VRAPAKAGVHRGSGGISWPALNRSVCALRFLYGVTLRQSDLPAWIPDARESQKLPVVLGTDEVMRFVEAVPSLKYLAALTTAYAAGLRASEAACLKFANIDKSRMVIHVEQGKSLPRRMPAGGGLDRYVMLSPQLLGILRSRWRLARPVAPCILSKAGVDSGSGPACPTGHNTALPLRRDDDLSSGQDQGQAFGIRCHRPVRRGS
jgi:integrase